MLSNCGDCCWNMVWCVYRLMALVQSCRNELKEKSYRSGNFDSSKVNTFCSEQPVLSTL
nr:MAG TPA: hypothetical protein [Caudoviricetes sp.]